MKLIITASYQDMSKRVADDLLELMKRSSSKLVSPASGDTPSGLFKELVSICQHDSVNINDWKFVGLDEWAGMNGETTGSCRDYLNRQLFQPLAIKEEQIFFFDGKKDLEPQCGQAETFIKKNGGIEVSILGLGLNGHIGMNEPGTAEASRSHIAAIAEQTQITGQKYFGHEQSLTHGLTLGIATIKESAHVFFDGERYKESVDC